ncbi:50S ribosomal protein L32 [Candidatus Dojkabacteria bacterium]|nr:50S ribosomal protein L32 [Candidatus Dojkabacteria bacterium]
MGALPKRRTSKGRKGRRRSHHALKKLNLVECPSCGKLKRSHEVCPNCGKYKGKDMIKTD